MEKKRTRICILLTAFLWLGTAPLARAAEPGFYIGITGGQTSFGLARREIDFKLTKTLGLDPGFELLASPSELHSEIDTHASGLTGLVGYRINRGFAVEAAYVNLGDLTYQASGTGVKFVEGILTPVAFTADLKTRVSGEAISLLADLFPPKRWELFLRGGVFLADTRPTSHVLAGSVVSDLGLGSESSTDFLVGVGTAAHLTDRWAIRLEYERFLNVGKSPGTKNDISLTSLGLLMHF